MSITDRLKKEALKLEAKLYSVKKIKELTASRKEDSRNNSRFNNSIYTIPNNDEIKKLILGFKRNILEIIAKEKDEYMKHNKESLKYLSYLEWAEQSISLIGDKYEDYDSIMINVYCPLIYINDKLGKQDNSNVKENAEKFFNKALELLNKNYKEPDKYVYTYLFVDKFGIRVDEAVELKNMLIDSGVLERDGSTSWKIEDRLNELLNNSSAQIASETYERE